MDLRPGQSADDTARRLTETADSPESIAREVGFGTEATLSRAFLRVLRISPLEYRERFT